MLGLLALAAGLADMGDKTGTSPYMGTTNLNSFGSDPNSSALRQSLASMPQFQALGQEASYQGSGAAYQGGSAYQSAAPYQQNAYQAKDMSQAALPQYDAMRERLNSQYSQQQGQSQDALDRQFAAAGGGPGNGAQAKQTENLSAGIAQQKGQDLLNVNAQEAQTRTALQQQENERAFQSGETQKGYGFQAQQADLGRQFQHGEAQQGYQFQSGEAAAQRNFTGQEDVLNRNQQTNQFNAQMGMQQNQFNFDANAKLAGLDLQYQQAQADQVNTAFNKQIASYQAKHSGGLLGGGGFLGTGIGA